MPAGYSLPSLLSSYFRETPKYYGSVEGDDISIDFHGERRYIPHVQLYRVDVVPILEQEIVHALDNGYFTVDAPRWTWKVRTSIERTLRVRSEERRVGKEYRLSR